MMNKQQFCNSVLGLALCLTTVGCAERYDFSGEKEANVTKLYQAEAFTTTTDYSIPVVDGYVTTVSYNGMTLARTSEAMTIKVPKQALAKGRANDGDLSVTYAQGVSADAYSNLWQTVMFEDSKNGDNDYNDIVIHANYQTNGTQLTVNVQPIALGSTKDIRLGFKWNKGGATGEHIVAENCREELFGGKTGFINTKAYDRHYNEFAKTVVSEEIPDDSSAALSITWFIDVDKDTRIYTANDCQYVCIDNNGMPYGFALTATGQNSASLAWKPSAATTAAWNAVIPDVSEWAVMPEQPAVAAGATVISGSQTLSGKTSNGFQYFVQGTLTLNSDFNSNNNAGTIVVLPGGTLNTGNGSLKNFTILNYGTMNAEDGVTFDNMMTVKSNANLVTDGTIKVNGGTVAIFGDVKAKTIDLNGSSNFYANSVDCTESFDMDNKGTVYLNGALDAKNISLANNSDFYVDCALRCSNKLTIDNSVNLFIKGYMNAKTIISSATINLCGGGLIETPSFSIGNGNSGSVTVIGDDMGVFKADQMDLGNSTSPAKLFAGNVGVVCPKITSKKTDYGSVVNNVASIQAPVIEGCSAGYNAAPIEDKGACWVAYPLEYQNIVECYNFDTWATAAPDYKVIDSSKVFDIHSASPAEGAPLKIFEMSE